MSISIWLSCCRSLFLICTYISISLNEKLNYLRGSDISGLSSQQNLSLEIKSIYYFFHTVFLDIDGNCVNKKLFLSTLLYKDYYLTKFYIWQTDADILSLSYILIRLIKCIQWIIDLDVKSHTWLLLHNVGI